MQYAEKYIVILGARAMCPWLLRRTAEWRFFMKLGLAGLIIDIGDVCGYTRKMCAAYEYCGDKAADFSVQCSKKALEEEAAKYPSMPEGYSENLCIYREICRKGVEFGAMLIHSAAIAVDGKGYLFTALSGTGKTTHIRLWQEKFGDRAVVVNGDKPIVRRFEGKFHVYGTPWCGKEGVNSNIHVPIEGICILERGEENKIERVSAHAAAAKLMEQTSRPKTAAGIAALLDILDALIKEVPVYRLFCNREPEAAEVSFGGMCRGK